MLDLVETPKDRFCRVAAKKSAKCVVGPRDVKLCSENMRTTKAHISLRIRSVYIIGSVRVSTDRGVNSDGESG